MCLDDCVDKKGDDVVIKLIEIVFYGLILLDVLLILGVEDGDDATETSSTVELVVVLLLMEWEDVVDDVVILIFVECWMIWF